MALGIACLLAASGGSAATAVRPYPLPVLNLERRPDHIRPSFLLLIVKYDLDLVASLLAQLGNLLPAFRATALATDGQISQCTSKCRPVVGMIESHRKALAREEQGDCGD